MEKQHLVKAVAIFVLLLTFVVMLVDFMFVNSSMRRYIHTKVVSSWSSVSEQRQPNQLINQSLDINIKGDSSCLAEETFRNTLLVLTFNFPFYGNIPILREMYEDVFAKVIMCGPKPDKKKTGFFLPDIELDITRGYFGYHCAAKAIEMHPGHKGYLYGNDDMIINWWNLVNRDKTKVWQGATIVDFRQDAFGKLVNNGWMWWTMDIGIKACQRYYNKLKEKAQNSSDAKTLLATFLDNGEGKPRCGKGWSDFFYIPGKHAQSFVFISTIAYKSKLFLEIAVNNMLRTLDKFKHFEMIKGLFLPDIGVGTDAKSFWKTYTTDLTFVHPYKMNLGDKTESLQQLRTRYLKYSKSKLKMMCKS